MPGHIDADWGTGMSGAMPKGMEPDAIKVLPPEWILIRTPIQHNKRIGKIIVPDTSQKSKEIPTAGRIIMMGEDQPEWIQMGDLVLYGKYTGVDVNFDCHESAFYYKICRAGNIYYVMEDSETFRETEQKSFELVKKAIDRAEERKRFEQELAHAG